MQITEIFKSISGESVQAGRPAIFIRTHGCLLRCSYCDSMYAVEGSDFKNMQIADILEACRKYTCKYVVLTGGEPLIQSDALELIRCLVDDGYQIEVETCGAVDISDIASMPNVTVTMDWKCSSSNMRNKMIESNLQLLDQSDVLKFVVGSYEDLDEMRRISSKTVAQCFVSPVFGQIDPKDIVEYILDNNLDYVRVQLQLHKLIWDPNMKGV